MIFKRRLRKPCKRCGVMFEPTGKFSRLCVDCLNNISRSYSKKRKYNCPFLSHNNQCTNKYCKTFRNSASKPICIYSKTIKCNLYRNTQSKLKTSSTPLKTQK